MIFRGKKISDYTSADIELFITNKIPESKDLDYKREIKFDEKSKSELIYDLSAFYNTEGGCMIIGLDEEKDELGKNTGIPKLPEEKISISNFDQVISRIEETIKKTTNPQLTGLSFSKLITFKDTHIYMIGIPKTQTFPTMVIYGNSNRFYKRKSNGKYILDTYELYQTFMQAGEIEEKINDFIQYRQQQVSEGKFWQKVGRLRSFIMHMIPSSSFNSIIENFSDPILKNIFTSELKVPGQHSYSYRYCIEGFHLYSNRNDQITPYNLLFRNGSIESFTNEALCEIDPGKPNLYNDAFLVIFKEQLENNFNMYKALNIDFPFYLSIKFNNTLNLGLIGKENRLIGRFEYDSLQLPILLLTNDLLEIKKQIKNMLDILWQGFGSNACPKNEFDKVFENFTM